ncbi:MAG: carbohydrate-binding domain-containing protein [Lachnospiraceae bacterium]|nr:carbohydrate-binding domain-containing protein [Lachnospiraceae bacterium]
MFKKKLLVGNKRRLAVVAVAIMLAAAGTACSFGTADASGIYAEVDVEEIDATIALSDSGSTASGSGVDISDDGATITITKSGTYEVSGELSEGRIVVDAENQDVVIILNGVTLTCEDKGAIFAKNADSLIVYVAEGTENTITSGTEEDYEAAQEAVATANAESASSVTEDTTESTDTTTEDTTDTTEDSTTTEDDGFTNSEKAAIMAKCDLRLTGAGTLTVNGYINNGIQSKGILLSDTLNLTVTSANDGVKAETDLDIEDGTYTITSYGDGMQSDGTLEIIDGTFAVTTGEGASSASTAGMGGEIPSGEAPSGEATTFDPTQMGGGRMNGGQMGAMGDTADTTTDADDSTAVSQKGVKAAGSVTISGGSFTINSVDDAVHSDSDVEITGGTLDISAGDDGIHAESALTIEDGTVNIETSNEGIEGATITINGGDIDVNATDDGMNASSDTDTPELTINGGDIYVSAEGDGLDSNGNLTINGGTVYVDGPSNGGNAALDVGTESGGVLAINGGDVTAIGMSQMLETVDASSTQVSVAFVFSNTVEAGTEVTVSDSSGNVIATYTTTKSSNCVILSSEEMEEGETYTFTYGETTETITADSVNATNYSGQSMGTSGMGGGRMGGQMGTQGTDATSSDSL